MKAFSNHPVSHLKVRCVACETHLRPQYVPWHQHAVGCAIRTALLQPRGVEPRRPITRAA